MDERYLKKCTTHLSSRLPKNLNIKKISVADVVNVTDPEDLFKKFKLDFSWTLN